MTDPLSPPANISTLPLREGYCPTCWQNNVPVLLEVPCATCEARAANQLRKKQRKENK